MVLAFAHLVAQGLPSTDPSAFDTFGPLAAFAALAVPVIGWLAKQLSDARAENRVLVDKIFTLAENSTPVLARTIDAIDRCAVSDEKSSAVMERNTAALERFMAGSGRGR